MNPKITSAIITFLLITGIASATVVMLMVYVNALITVPLNIIFPQSLIGEENQKIIFHVNSTTTDPINITSFCSNPNLFSAILITPIGSSISQVNFNNNGSTIITPNLTIGDVMIKKRSLVEGIANCTLIFDPGNNTNITFVNELS